MRFAAWPAAYLLMLVPAIIALFAYAFRRRRLALAAFVTGELAPRVLPPTGDRRGWPRALCLAAAAACLVVALMGPQWGPGGQELPLRGRDVIVLLDVSASMLAEDVAPRPKLRRARWRSRCSAMAATGSVCSPSPAAPTCSAR
jgi:Ca-activated chloride channel homolog